MRTPRIFRAPLVRFFPKNSRLSANAPFTNPSLPKAKPSRKYRTRLPNNSPSINRLTALTEMGGRFALGVMLLLALSITAASLYETYLYHLDLPLYQWKLTIVMAVVTVIFGGIFAVSRLLRRLFRPSQQQPDLPTARAFPGPR